MGQHLDLFDVVALINDYPEANLRRGQVGTVVEELGPGVYEIEFSDDEGRTYRMVALPCELLDRHPKVANRERYNEALAQVPDVEPEEFDQLSGD